jgi:hypothetical protein
VEQPIQRLFFALAAANTMKVYGGDATDAFAHSPPPDTPTFVHVDEAYAEWYEDQNKAIIKIRLRRHKRASRADDPAWLTNERGD